MNKNLSRIVSASRRTDIIAFHYDWLKEKIKEGYCITANPFNPGQKKRVSLDPYDVDCIVFWTRNPANLLKDNEIFMDGLTFFEFMKKNYNFYFLFTITGYPKELESNLPPLEDTIRSFQRLSSELFIEKWKRRTGNKHIACNSGQDEESPVVWRFDPIAICSVSDFDYNRETFSKIAAGLEGFCTRVVISVYDPYKKVERRLKKSGITILSIEEMLENKVFKKQFADLLSHLKESSGEHGISIQSCCEDLEEFGIKSGKCIDDDLVFSLFGIRPSPAKDLSQRKNCRCVKSSDVGTYKTCFHGCKYCYAN